MNDIWSAYLNMFNDKNIKQIEKNKKISASIINQDADDQTNDQTEDTDEEFESDEQQDDNQESDNDQQSVSDEEQKDKKSAYLNFSADLASEFGNTCNKFTTLAAKVVKQRTVEKETADQLSKIIEKLKSLIEAANNSI